MAKAFLISIFKSKVPLIFIIAIIIAPNILYRDKSYSYLYLLDNYYTKESIAYKVNYRSLILYYY